MSQSLSEFREKNISSLIYAGVDPAEAARLVENIIKNRMEPAVSELITEEDVINATAVWAVSSPITEANILIAD